jgi:hypothetical protein
MQKRTRIMKFVQVSCGKFLVRNMDLILRSEDTIKKQINGHATLILKLQ